MFSLDGMSQSRPRRPPTGHGICAADKSALGRAAAQRRSGSTPRRLSNIFFNKMFWKFGFSIYTFGPIASIPSRAMKRVEAIIKPFKLDEVKEAWPAWVSRA